MGKRIWLINKYATPNKYPRHFGLGKELARLGNEVTLICSTSNNVAPNDVPVFNGWKKVENHDGLKVVWMNGPSLSKNGIMRILSWFIFEFKVIITQLFDTKPDVVVSSSLSLMTVWSGLLLTTLRRAKFIVEIRDIWPLSLIELANMSPSNPLIRLMSVTEKIGYKKADLILGTMPNLFEHVLNVTPGMEKKVKCLPQGVYLEIFESLAQNLSDEYIKKYIPQNKFIVAYTGTLNPNNPIDTLLESAEILQKKNTHIHFLILGNGTKKEEYQKRAEGLDNVTFPPPIDKSEMAHFLSFVQLGYDAFSSVLATYGLSRNKWIDYMYNECPIICSYDGYQSMINEANAGSFVPFGDPVALSEEIERYSHLPEEEIKSMGEKAKKYIVDNRQFSTLAKQFLNYLPN